MTTIFHSLLLKVGFTQQKIDVLESMKQESQDYIQIYKNYIEKYQRQIDECDYKLEKLRRKTN